MKEHYKFYDWKFPAELSLIIVYILYFLYARNRDNLETYSLNQPIVENNGLNCVNILVDFFISFVL